MSRPFARLPNIADATTETSVHAPNTTSAIIAKLISNSLPVRNISVTQASNHSCMQPTTMPRPKIPSGVTNLRETSRRPRAAEHAWASQPRPLGSPDAGEQSLNGGERARREGVRRRVRVFLEWSGDARGLRLRALVVQVPDPGATGCGAAVQDQRDRVRDERVSRSSRDDGCRACRAHRW